MKDVLVWLLAMRWRLALVVAGLAVWQWTMPLANGLLVFQSLLRSPRQALLTAALSGGLVGFLLWLGGNPVEIAAGLLLSWALVIGIASVVAKYNSLNLALQTISVLAIAAVLIWAMVIPDPQTHYRVWVDELFTPMLQQAQLPLEPARMDLLASLVPGFVVWAMHLSLVISLVLGRYWQSLLTGPGRFGEEFRQFRLGLMAGVPATLGLVAGALLNWPGSRNLLLVCGWVLLLQGLAVAHMLAKIWKTGKAPLAVMYVSLVFLPQAVGPLVLTVGLVDNWIDLRGRLRPRN